ncbi:MAG: hypothetical protein MZW92_55280 [Comamonadaceae bacterium]|nr:hypothetical protein [Comamonadaceae bacterium]
MVNRGRCRGCAARRDRSRPVTSRSPTSPAAATRFTSWRPTSGWWPGSPASLVVNGPGPTGGAAAFPYTGATGSLAFRRRRQCGPGQHVHAGHAAQQAGRRCCPAGIVLGP